jgi:hypothetical protein
MAQLTDQINLRALRGFHAIVSTGSVTEAARRMGLSQPAVSRLLAQLEQQIGFELFFRDHGRLVPTQDGLLLYEEVDLSLGSVERVFSLIRDIADYRVGQLKVVAPPSFSEGVLPDRGGVPAAFSARAAVRRFAQHRDVEGDDRDARGRLRLRQTAGGPSGPALRTCGQQRHRLCDGGRSSVVRP